MDGMDILKGLENHCGEKLNCSRRLRFQIEQTLQRLIDEKDTMTKSISNVLNGFETFNPKTQKAISKRQS